jgi:hypothetical protein
MHQLQAMTAVVIFRIICNMDVISISNRHVATSVAGAWLVSLATDISPLAWLVHGWFRLLQTCRH